MTNKKTTIIIIIVFTTLIIGALIAYYFMFIAPKKDIAEKCQGFVPNWVDYIDCHGVVSINDGWDMDYISLKDHVHEYEIARVYNQDQYIYTDNKIFVINKKIIEGSVSNGKRIKYYQELFQNGELKTNYYDIILDIPTYLIINTVSGEVKAHKDITEVPEVEKSYFIQLENK